MCRLFYSARPHAGPLLSPLAWLLGCFCFAALALLGVAASFAQEPAGVPPLLDDAADWALERVRMRGGKTYEGLVQAEREEAIEFAEILRPRGKPMFMVVRPLLRKDITSVVRLRGGARQRLERLVNAFRHRARIEAERMEDVTLEESVFDGERGWSYRGDWFRLESTAEAETARRFIVRIEQMFRAYRQVLPPRQRPGRVLRVVIFGSMDRYRQHLHERGFEIENPAFYSARENVIVAGCDLERFARRLRTMRSRNETLRKQYEQLDDQFNSRFADTARQLRQNGFTGDEIRFERQVRLAAWKRELRAMLEKIDRVDRRNERDFARVVGQIFSRLYHEAFHAYLENYVYPSRTYEVPRWLNEGLAQIFEDGQLDGELLRIDAPGAEKLRQLQAHLNEGGLTLREFLEAEQQALVMSHSRSLSYRHYLYAWGLAWHLTFQTGDLDRQGLTDYARRPGAQVEADAGERFEQLVQMPLEQFEQRWRQSMLELTARGRR